MNPMVMTATGPLHADQLGPTLAHEHLYCDISPQSKKADNMVTNPALMAREKGCFAAAGFRSIIEVTPIRGGGTGADFQRMRASGWQRRIALGAHSAASPASRLTPQLCMARASAG